MSTNKTQNYTLHSWLPTDDFQLSEINQNFAALDAVLGVLPQKLEVVTGAYTGNGAESRTIDLGRKPVALIIEVPGGYRAAGSGVVYGGLVTQSYYLDGYAKITDTGFELKAQVSNGNYYLNETNRSYHYIAFFS